MKSSDVEKNSLGYVICNSKMVDAIKAYQKDRGLTVDGIIGKATSITLKDDATTYYKLGDRILTEGMSGTDVSELKNLLIDKGIIKGKKKEKFDVTKLDETMCEEIESFITESGNKWRGVIDKDVIALLKK